MQRENAFDADTIGDLAYSKASAISAIRSANHHSFKDLNTFFIPFDDLGMDTDRVAWLEIRNASLTLACFKSVNNVAHDGFLRKAVSAQQSTSFGL
jgi:hypothetical protein